MNKVKHFSNGSLKMPAIGQGAGLYSWNEKHVDVIREGIDLGMNFIDTSEGYDNGQSEVIIGKAVKRIRDKVIIGTKFSPENSSYDSVLKAVDGSLKRLNTDYIDLYQIHWPNPQISLEETLSAMQKILKDGKVRHIGMGNTFLKELNNGISLTDQKISSVQLEYNLFDRTVEDDVLPFCEQHDIMLIGYSPLDKGKLIDGNYQREQLKIIAQKHGKTPAQVILRWLIDKPSVVVIPKASNVKHLRENAASADFDLEENDINKIDEMTKKMIVYVNPEKIKVSLEGEENRVVYQSLEQAKENKLGFVPSPLALAQSIKDESFVKPVRLIKSSSDDSDFEYDLIEGRIRYWAWVIAHGNNPIPAYVRENLNKF